VVSNTLKADDCEGIAVISGNVAGAVGALKAQNGKDIWLMGGGVLFRSLLDAGVVDGLDLMVMPVLLGSGVPLLPVGRRQLLRLEESKVLASGIVMLSHSIAGG